MLSFFAAAETNKRFAERTKQVERNSNKPKQAMNMSNLLFGMAPGVEREIVKLGQIKAGIEVKANRLELGARCPHQLDFLFNLSQELLPPLNGILALAKLLAENGDNNLSPVEIDYAQTIYSSGTHLQSQIDNIIDLAKIKSGAVTLNIEAERFADLRSYFVRRFHQEAQDKELTFEVELFPGLPPAIYTDGKRLQQIIDILLSNAFKFTKQGGVTLRIAPTEYGRMPTATRSNSWHKWVEFSIADTGIGIPESRQRGIVEAFYETNCKIRSECRGAGLGLSICGDLMRMLEGEIQFSSKEGVGSCFTLYLPLREDWVTADVGIAQLSATSPISSYMRRDAARGTAEIPLMLAAQPRPYRGPKSRRSDDGAVLIVESDAQTASLMLDLVRSNGYQGEVAADLGKLQGLIGEIKPDAIILGINPSDGEGWEVFHQLKHNPETRQLPVSMICLNGWLHKCIQIGGLRSSDGDAIKTPIRATPQATLDGLSAVAGRAIKKLLVADAAENLLSAADVIWRLNDTEVVVLDTGTQVIDALRQGNFDAMVLGPALQDMSADDLMNRVMATDLPADLPIAMIGIDRESGEERTEIAILKRQNEFAEVLAETTQFLRRAVVHRPSAGHEIPSGRRMHALELAGRKALIVDDICNIYAITGILEQQGMIVFHAENSTEGIEVLRDNPDMNAVLLDTTVAGLDSHGLIGIIRGIAGLKSLPIITVIDKDATDYRWECIGAGASDTIDKPVNVEQLLSLLRAWLVRVR